MNALFLNHISEYKYSETHFATCQNIILYKAAAQNRLLKRYKAPTFNELCEANDIENLLLFEARAARHFWRQLRLLLPQEYRFFGRIQHGGDVVNKLLDVGYHHITNKVFKECESLGIQTEIGLFHTAHRESAHPLVYDLVELFRSDLVDRSVLKFLRQKKVKVETLGQGDIRHFLFLVKQQMEKQVYLKSFKRCHPFSYFMTLQILHFQSAINHKKVFVPLTFPGRHEARCS